jgi:putative tricarboxylic transport membrane protein
MDYTFYLGVLKNVFLPFNLLMATFGVVIGIIFGALPGFTAAMGIAILMPITFSMTPEAGLIMMGALFAGAMWGGSVSAILINTPGTPAAAATVLDGYPMAQQGRAADALRESVMASFWGGILGVIVLMLFAPPLARVSLMFGPPEYFLLGIFGMTIIASLSEKMIVKGFLSGVLGMLIATMGMDPLLGIPRFTFGVTGLIDGVMLVPALIGLFSIPEVLEIIQLHFSKGEAIVSMKNIKLGFPTWAHTKRLTPTYLRSSIIGLVVGILPGAGGSIASFMAYNEERRASKTPEKFGTGMIEGVAASEAANNAVCGGAFIPMLTLGVPGDSVAAIMMGGLMIHGLTPGAELFTTYAKVTWTFIFSLYLSNVLMLLFGLYCAPWFAFATKTPRHILAISIILLTTVGSFAVRGSMTDVYVMLAFGILGYLLKSHGFDVVPVVLGLILGPMAEKGLNGTLAISVGQNTAWFILQRPVSLILLGMTVMALLIPYFRSKSKKDIFASGEPDVL